MPTPEQFQFAKDILNRHKRNIRDAESLAGKARIISVRACSRQLKRNRELCATSVNDILDQMGCTGLLRDSELRSKLLIASKVLNNSKRSI